MIWDREFQISIIPSADRFDLSGGLLRTLDLSKALAHLTGLSFSDVVNWLTGEYNELGEARIEPLLKNSSHSQSVVVLCLDVNWQLAIISRAVVNGMGCSSLVPLL